MATKAKQPEAEQPHAGQPNAGQPAEDTAEQGGAKVRGEAKDTAQAGKASKAGAAAKKDGAANDGAGKDGAGKNGAAKGQAVKSTEEHAFQAEMQQLLHIIVHSLYSEREIFLRELISNASDALNKLRFLTLTQPDVRDPEVELEITLEVDEGGEDDGTKAIIVSDTGIGMTHDELIESLGTIARSGTLDFVKQLSGIDPGKRTEMIGQFGVGFYSVFMVTGRVIVDTCPADPAEPAWRWISDGGGGYSLEPSDRTARGTSVRVELREEAAEFAQAYRVETVVKRYSNFVPHPVRLDGRQLNSQEAIWSLPKAEVTQEQYTEFYKYLTHGIDEPQHTIHLSIDAPVQYRALLFVPKQLTNEMLYSRTGWGLKLYANRVFIQDDCQELMPLYLRFLRGVLDSEDLPLNVSREMVQQNPLLAKIRTSLTGRVLRELKALSEGNAERYATFFREYGKVLKEGITADQPNQERLLELARYNSSVCSDEKDLTTLKDYVSRMRDDQQEIFYFSGPSRDAIERNPSLEFFRKRGLEVLYFYDQVDDFVMAQLQEYDGKKFASIDQADLETLKDAAEVTAGDQPALEGDALDKLIGYVKETLGERVADVIASKRLVESPAVLVNPDGQAASISKMMRLIDQSFAAPQKILEINPGHSLVRNLSALLSAEPEEPLVREITEQMFENCLLVEGMIDRPEKMVTRIQALMERAAELRVAAIGEAPVADTEEEPPTADA